MNVNKIDESTITVEIDSELYSESVVFKCIYWYGNQFEIDIVKKGLDFFVKIKSKGKALDYDHLVSKLKNDLIDFKTREIVNAETRNIRELLIAKAFSHEDEYDQPPPGDVNDPVGFDPSKV
jgi:His-Xaa-Ser system protein HxsD